MNNKLYVGNLSFSVTESSLEAAFAKIGTVQSAKIVSDRDTGRSKGFAFVEMSNNAEGEAAISKLDGTDFEGRTMKVSAAKPKTEGTGGGNFNRRY